MRAHQAHADKARGRFLKHVLLGLFSFSVGMQATAAVTEATPTAGSAEEIRAFIRANPGSLVLPQAVAGLYEKLLAKNSITDLTDFIEEFTDFPDLVDKAKAARLKVAGLETRYTFREGKIGERYVPGYSVNRTSTETVTINGKSHYVTKTDKDYISGYSSDRRGYTVVYQVFNESKQPHVIKVRLSGTSSSSEYQARDAWTPGDGKGEGQYLLQTAQGISKEMSYLIDAGENIKDQTIAGETQPGNFVFEIIEINPVSKIWLNGLTKALDGKSDLKEIARFLADPLAAPWHKNLQNQFARMASKLIDVKFVTDQRFDPDFSSPVVVFLTNQSTIDLNVNIKPNFSSNRTLVLKPNAEHKVTLQALGVAKSSLQVEFSRILPILPEPTTENINKSKTYADGVSRRADAVNQRISKARLAEVQQTRKNNASATLKAGDLISDCDDICPDMVFVPGNGNMKDFEIGKYEVTFDEWDACVKDGGCNGYAPEDNAYYYSTGNDSFVPAVKRGRRPVVNVSHSDAKTYIDWLNKKTGSDYRLPSILEWEHAARAGATTRFNTGNCITREQANFDWDGNQVKGCNVQPGEWVWHVRRTMQVGSYLPNSWGLHDTHGNVWEWVGDECKDTNPRIIAGGSWKSTSHELGLSDYRIFHREPACSSRWNEIGFRLFRPRSQNVSINDKKTIAVLARAGEIRKVPAEDRTENEGFESGSLGGWMVTSDASITAEKSRTGKKSLKITNGCGITKIIPPSLRVDITLWIYVEDLTEAYESLHVSLEGASQGPSIWSRRNGYFHYKDGTHENMKTGGFDFKQWFKVRIVQDAHASDHKYIYYVNDMQMFTSNKIDIARPIEKINIKASNNKAGKVTAYVDDISIIYH